jgi:hypothetical protein
MNFDNHKFHCSSLAYLLVDPRTKGETLSETTKTFLREEWIKAVYGREKVISTKYMTKGIAVESDSLELVSQVMNTPLFKNKKTYENDYLIGTPDVILDSEIVDIKSSWDIWTYASVDENDARKNYYAQLLGYMMLTGKMTSRLIYALSNTPESTIQDELYRLSFQKPEINNSDEETARFRKNYIFDDIPLEKRIKVFEFEYDAAIEQKIVERVKLSREYLNNFVF